MIPKKIHYCWFGPGQIPEKDRKCIDSWKKYCQDYEIILWNESNYDVTKNKYMEQAYKEHKWGFVPDYARLDIIYSNGGIYLDTDVEIIKPFDDLLVNAGFAGFESDEYIALGLGFGAEKGNPFIKKQMDQYNDLSFYNDDGSLNTTASPVLSAQIFEQNGFVMNGRHQEIDGFHIYPKEYFCPMDYQTGEVIVSNNTYSIHWYNASWFPKIRIEELEIKRKLCRMFGVKIGPKAFLLYKYLLNPKRLFMRLKYKDDMYYKEQSHGSNKSR